MHISDTSASTVYDTLDHHNLVDGMDLWGKGKLLLCNGCTKGKYHQAPCLSLSTNQATTIVEHLHMDLHCGPVRHIDLRVPLHTPLLWLMTIIEKGRRNSSSIKAKPQNWLKSSLSSSRPILGHVWRPYSLTMVVNLLMVNYNHTSNTKALPTNYQHHIHYSRMVSLDASTRPHITLAMLEDTKMSKHSWPKAHEYANYVHNCSPTKALMHSTPNETFYDWKLSISTLHISRSHCHVCVSPKLGWKLDTHFVNGILCGFEWGSKAYRVYNRYHPNTNLLDCEMLLSTKRYTAIMMTTPHPHQILLLVRGCLHPLLILIMLGQRGWEPNYPIQPSMNHQSPVSSIYLTFSTTSLSICVSS